MVNLASIISQAGVKISRGSFTFEFVFRGRQFGEGGGLRVQSRSLAGLIIWLRVGRHVATLWQARQERQPRASAFPFQRIFVQMSVDSLSPACFEFGNHGVTNATAGKYFSNLA